MRVPVLKAGEVVTGLLYINEKGDDLNARLNTVAVPLNSLGTADLVPGAGALDAINAGLR